MERKKHWCLDKDIIKQGNKIYSPERCCLVSNYINCLFINSKANRGKYPVGVTYHRKKFEVNIEIKKQRKYIGAFDTYKKAFIAYKKAKEEIIKKVAKEEYRKKIL